MSSIAYRYCDDLAAQAGEIVKSHYDEFLKYHGSDLVLYPDGASLEDDLQKEFRAINESISKKIPSTSGRKSNLDEMETAMDLLNFAICRTASRSILIRMKVRK